MKLIFLICVLMVPVLGQGVSGPVRSATPQSLKPLVDTEYAFAELAARQGIKSGFLAFLADDGVVFEPTERNGKQFWKAAPESKAFLSWKPVWADVSSDGRLGYTIGPWEYREGGKSAPVNATGSFMTIWMKQADGNFKAVVDIGVSHPAVPDSVFEAPADAGKGIAKVPEAFDGSALMGIFSRKSLAGGYFDYMSDDVRMLREGVTPLIGRQKAFVGLEALDRKVTPNGVLKFGVNQSAVFGNMIYVTGTYDLTFRDQSTMKWSFVEVWKFRGKWELVADVFKPVPEVKK